MARTLIAVSLAVFCSLAACSKEEPGDAAPTPAAPGGGESGGDVNKTVDDMLQTADDAADMAKQAADDAAKKVAEVSQEAKDTLDAYLKKLEELTGVLGGVEGMMDVATNSPQVKAISDELKTHYATLAKLSPEAMTSLKDMFKDQIGAATEAFRAQIDRLSQDSSLSSIAQLAKSVPLFE
jgi:ABC-type transporter Mla subunit MlaD